MVRSPHATQLSRRMSDNDFINKILLLDHKERVAREDQLWAVVKSLLNATQADGFKLERDGIVIEVHPVNKRLQ